MSPTPEELRIFARKLSSPGPRMMLETRLDPDDPPRRVRVIVTDTDAGQDVAAFLEGAGASAVHTETLGSDIHIVALFED